MKPESVLFAAGFLGCCSVAFQVVGCADNEAPVSSAALVPGVEPAAVIPVSAETTEATNGVTSWRIYNEGEQTIRVLGADADDRVITETRFHVALDDNGNLLGVVVESALPEGGFALVGRDGLVAEGMIDADGVSVDVLGAMVSDFQSVGDDPIVHSLSWGCAKATAKMVVLCGKAVATCVASHGLSCVTAGTACYDAARNFLCKCKHRGC